MIIKINPNEKYVNQIIQKLKDNDGYCPCSIIKNQDTKCMCKEFREYTTEGYCHCGLYYKPPIIQTTYDTKTTITEGDT